MVAATYGEGEPTDDAMKFKKWLEYDGHSDDELKGANTPRAAAAFCQPAHRPIHRGSLGCAPPGCGD